MPTIVVPNIPEDVYERLCERADEEHRSVEDELLALAERAMQSASPMVNRQMAYVPGDEFPAPYDLPRPGQPVRIADRPSRQPRLPDPVASTRE